MLSTVKAFTDGRHRLILNDEPRRRDMKKDRAAYLREYAKNYTTARITFRKDSREEMEVLEFLKAQPDTSAYLKALVKADMEKQGK